MRISQSFRFQNIFLFIDKIVKVEYISYRVESICPSQIPGEIFLAFVKIPVEISSSASSSKCFSAISLEQLSALFIEVFPCLFIVIDGCAMLHSAIHWPKGGKVDDLLAGVRHYISKKLSTADVYLIFDRYREFSIKSDTRQERLDQYRSFHTLTETNPLPSKEVVLRVTKTKVQLIEMLKTDLIKNLPVFAKKTHNHIKRRHPRATSPGTTIKAV